MAGPFGTSLAPSTSKNRRTPFTRTCMPHSPSGPPRVHYLAIDVDFRNGSWLRDNALTQPATLHVPANVVRHGRSEQFFPVERSRTVSESSWGNAGQGLARDRHAMGTLRPRGLEMEHEARHLVGEECTKSIPAGNHETHLARSR